MVPVPAIAAGAVELAGDGARINLFAGFALGTRAPLDLGNRSGGRERQPVRAGRGPPPRWPATDRPR